MIDFDTDATNVAGEERSSHVNVHTAVDRKLLTIPHIIPSRSPRECQRGMKLCLKGKAMRVQTGNLEMLCFVLGAKKKKVVYAGRRAACTGGTILVWMRYGFSGIPLTYRPTNRSYGLSRKALLGFEHNLTHLDGHTVILKRDGVTQPGEKSKLSMMNAKSFSEYLLISPRRLRAKDQRAGYACIPTRLFRRSVCGIQCCLAVRAIAGNEEK